MQNSNEKEARTAIQQEMMTKLWSGDISSLSHKEILTIIQNMFYQIFLVDIEKVHFELRSNDDGLRVKFIIEGEAFGDIENLSQDEIDELLEEDE